MHPAYHGAHRANRYTGVGRLTSPHPDQAVGRRPAHVPQGRRRHQRRCHDDGRRQVQPVRERRAVHIDELDVLVWGQAHEHDARRSRSATLRQHDAAAAHCFGQTLTVHLGRGLDADADQDEEQPGGHAYRQADVVQIVEQSDLHDRECNYNTI